MAYVTQHCPCGLQWRREDSSSTSTLHIWARKAAPWLDTSRYTIQVDQSHVSIKVLVLTDLYPLIQCGLRCPPFTDGGPPTLIYGTGPWTGDNICTALEFFFQSNAYHPQATCDKCGHSGSVPISLRVDYVSTVQSIPGQTSVDPRREEERGHGAILDTSLEAESEKWPCTGVQTPPEADSAPVASMVHQPPSSRGSDNGRLETGSPSGDDPGHRESGSHHHDHKPSHRRIVHFCEGCLQRGESECESDHRHNRHHIEAMEFLESAGVFQGRTIPLGATINHPVSPLEFQRILARMALRKACGVDGVPAEILKHSPESFQENLRHLINMIFASEFKLPKETLLSKVVLLYKKGDPSLLGNYRPIALLTSTYQLMNLLLAGRLQDLAERNRVFESSQYGFRWLHRVTDSVQKQQLLLKFAMAGDGTLIRVDLDYANAFNSAGHACLWAILEKFGVPDIDLLKNFYDLASMRLHVGAHETADIFMDTGTAQGSALSPLLFILFINALLRLFDKSGLQHGVDRAPQFNHLAFADDLSLYLNSEANANRLLEKVLQFERWSGLRLALSKSLITGILHGKGATRKASAKKVATAREFGGGVVVISRAFFESFFSRRKLTMDAGFLKTSKICINKNKIFFFFRRSKRQRNF